MPDINPAVAYRGTLDPQEQRFTRSYDPTNGIVDEYDYEGHAPDRLIALSNYYASQKIAHRLVLQDGKASIQISDTSKNFSIDGWQIKAADDTNNGWEHPDILALLNYGDGSSFYIDQINILKHGIDERSSWANLQPRLDVSVRDSARLMNEYSLQARGSTDYPISQHVLCHTTNVSNRYGANIADANVDRIYSAAQLLVETQNANLNNGGWVNPLPGELVYLVQYLNTTGAPDPQAGYVWGWLKSSATRTSAANNRIDITSEYRLAQWETVRLKLAIT